MNNAPANIVIFASGSGSNAENIILHSSDKKTFCVKAVICNKSEAFVLKRAERFGIPAYIQKPSELKADKITIDGAERCFTDFLKEMNADYLILAGYLLKIPEYLINAYPEAILNVHPALLPNYGGKGMYGEHVHKAVIAAGEKRSGITIHLADSLYDHGKIIYQSECEIAPDDTPETLAAKIHTLESAYPQVIESYIEGRK